MSTGASLLSLLLSAPPAAQGNVFLVVLDDVGVDKVACYGEGAAPPPTPTLDALAAAGVRFERCWTNPVCSPTRATLQTGRYSFRTGVGTAIPFGPPLKLAERTLPEALAELASPHATAAFGKWHLGGHLSPPIAALNPNLQGYGHFAGALAGALVGPFDYFFWPRTVDGETGISSVYATTANVDDALSWIADRDGPWLAYLAFNAAHTPFHAPPADLHSQELSGLDPCADPVPFHDAMVQALDAELGRLLSSLPPDVRAATSVIVVGDNGSTGAVVLPPDDPAHGKGSLYQGGVRVPLIVSGPAVVLPGRVETAPVNTTDLFATVLELCGASPAQLAGGPPEDSVSLVPYLAHPLQPDLRAHAFAETFQGGWLAPAAAALQAARPARGRTDACAPGAGAVLASGKALRNAVYKLIRFDDGREELYHLPLDPGETVDVLALPFLPPAAAQAYAELAGALDELLDS